eukprot:498617-Pyramimonas_sp.AAC.1
MEPRVSRVCWALHPPHLPFLPRARDAVACEFLMLRAAPPAHPETTLRRVEVMREVVQQRGGQPN